jgi:hypothetical protein
MAAAAVSADATAATRADAPEDIGAVTRPKRAVTLTARKTVAKPKAGAKGASKSGVKTGASKKPPPKKPPLKTSAANETPLATAVIEAPPGNAPEPPDIDKPAIRRSVTGRALVTRVARAVERELTEIETIVGKTKSRTDAERRVRTLASLARTIGEVIRLREQQQARRDDDDDTVPRDLDEFRDTLARRLEQIIAARSLRTAGDPEPE